jgi:hypothetical protein
VQRGWRRTLPICSRRLDTESTRWLAGTRGPSPFRRAQPRNRVRIANGRAPRSSTRAHPTPSVFARRYAESIVTSWMRMSPTRVPRPTPKDGGSTVNPWRTSTPSRCFRGSPMSRPDRTSAGEVSTASSPALSPRSIARGSKSSRPRCSTLKVR